MPGKKDKPRSKSKSAQKQTTPHLKGGGSTSKDIRISLSTGGERGVDQYGSPPTPPKIDIHNIPEPFRRSPSPHKQKTPQAHTAQDFSNLAREHDNENVTQFIQTVLTSSLNALNNDDITLTTTIKITEEPEGRVNSAQTWPTGMADYLRACFNSAESIPSVSETGHDRYFQWLDKHEPGNEDLGFDTDQKANNIQESSFKAGLDNRTANAYRQSTSPDDRKRSMTRERSSDSAHGTYTPSGYPRVSSPRIYTPEGYQAAELPRNSSRGGSMSPQLNLRGGGRRKSPSTDEGSPSDLGKTSRGVSPTYLRGGAPSDMDTSEGQISVSDYTQGPQRRESNRRSSSLIREGVQRNPHDSINRGNPQFREQRPLSRSSRSPRECITVVHTVSPWMDNNDDSSWPIDGKPAPMGEEQSLDFPTSFVEDPSATSVLPISPTMTPYNMTGYGNTTPLGWTRDDTTRHKHSNKKKHQNMKQEKSRQYDDGEQCCNPMPNGQCGSCFQGEADSMMPFYPWPFSGMQMPMAMPQPMPMPHPMSMQMPHPMPQPMPMSSPDFQSSQMPFMYPWMMMPQAGSFGQQGGICLCGMDYPPGRGFCLCGTDHPADGDIGLYAPETSEEYTGPALRAPTESNVTLRSASLSGLGEQTPPKTSDAPKPSDDGRNVSQLGPIADVKIEPSTPPIRESFNSDRTSTSAEMKNPQNTPLSSSFMVEDDEFNGEFPLLSFLEKILGDDGPLVEQDERQKAISGLHDLPRIISDLPHGAGDLSGGNKDLSPSGSNKYLSPSGTKLDRSGRSPSGSKLDRTGRSPSGTKLDRTGRRSSSQGPKGDMLLPPAATGKPKKSLDGSSKLTTSKHPSKEQSPNLTKNLKPSLSRSPYQDLSPNISIYSMPEKEKKPSKKRTSSSSPRRSKIDGKTSSSSVPSVSHIGHNRYYEWIWAHWRKDIYSDYGLAMDRGVARTEGGMNTSAHALHLSASAKKHLKTHKKPKDAYFCDYQNPSPTSTRTPSPTPFKNSVQPLASNVSIGPPGKISIQHRIVVGNKY